MKDRDRKDLSEAEGQQAAAKGRQQRGPHRPADTGLVSQSDHMGQNHGAAHGDAEKEGNNQADERRRAADGRHGIAPAELSHHSDIRRVEQLLEHLGQRDGNGQPEQAAAYRAVQDIDLFCLCRSHRPPPFLPSITLIFVQGRRNVNHSDKKTASAVSPADVSGVTVPGSCMR